MPLHSGTKLGPYEILGPLGAGGMGEVYRARDTRLGRDIALKILPDHLSSNHERLRRFEQEARAASALNHPNIISIYDFGQSGSTFYMAMEFVDGRTLREILSTGSIPGRKLLDIAVQIADGLARAHAAGIIHRDLKPANVMISKDGFTKILDFGLAKLAEPQLEELSELPTVEKKQELTQSGAILGTVTYMSPEQAAGRPIDCRSDQFSFGSILYEMEPPECRLFGGRQRQKRSRPLSRKNRSRSKPRILKFLRLFAGSSNAVWPKIRKTVTFPHAISHEILQVSVTTSLRQAAAIALP